MRTVFALLASVVVLTAVVTAGEFAMIGSSAALVLIIGVLLVTEPLHNLNLNLAIARLSPAQYGVSEPIVATLTIVLTIIFVYIFRCRGSSPQPRESPCPARFISLTRPE